MEHNTDLTARLVSAVYRHQLAFLNRRLTPLNLGGGSYVFLLYIIECPGITQHELSQRLMIDKGTVSKMLNRLEKAGMIRRKANPDDRRSIIITVTPHGEETYQRMQEQGNEYHKLMVEGLSREEISALEQSLRKILDNVSSANQRDRLINGTVED